MTGWPGAEAMVTRRGGGSLGSTVAAGHEARRLKVTRFRHGRPRFAVMRNTSHGGVAGFLS
jgi:hypothetical protein